MANLEILSLDTATPQIRAPGSGDGYVANRAVLVNEVVGSSALTLTGATQTTSQPVLNATQTWNASGTTFTALKLNVTNTASAASSLLMDLQVGGTSQFSIRKDGIINIPDMGNSSGSAPVIVASASNGIGISSALGLVVSSASGGNIFAVGYSSVYLGSVTRLGWMNGASVLGGTSADLSLTRKAAANLQLGAADAAAPVAQTFGVQSVVAGTSNTAGADFTIRGSQGTGTGAGGSIIFQVAPAGSSGTSQNALTTALTVASDRSALFAGTVSLGSTGYGIINTGNNICFQTGSVVKLQISGSGLMWGGSNTSYPVVLGNSNDLQWSSTGAFAGVDLILTRDAGDTLAQRRSTNAQTFNIYNTYTSGTSYERAGLYWSSNVFYVAGQKGSGGGTLRGVSIGSAATDLVSFYGATPIVQPTTAVAAATVAATGTGDVVAASTTFDGYTIPQIVKALRNAGLLA